MSIQDGMTIKKIDGKIAPPEIFLSEATSDGEEATESFKAPYLKKCEAVLTDVELSSDEDDKLRYKCVTPSFYNCSSESQVVESIVEPYTCTEDSKSKIYNEYLTDTENMNVSDEDDLNDKPFGEEKEHDMSDSNVYTCISDQMKTANKTKQKMTSRSLKGITKTKCPTEGNKSPDNMKKNYLTLENRIVRKKKKKTKVLLSSCLTDTEDVDVPSDMEQKTQVSTQDSTQAYKHSEISIKQYNDRIKNSTKKSQQCTLMEFLTDRLDEAGLTDTDDMVYTDYEGDDIDTTDMAYELEFGNIDNKEMMIEGSKKIPSSRSASDVSGDEDRRLKNPRRVKSPKVQMLGVKPADAGLTDTEDLGCSDVEDPHPKCPTPIILIEDSTVSQNEGMKLAEALQAIEGEPVTDSEDVLLGGKTAEEESSGDETAEEDFGYGEEEPPCAITPDVVPALTDTGHYISSVEGSRGLAGRPPLAPSPVSQPGTDSEDLQASADEASPRPVTPALLLQHLEDDSFVHATSGRNFGADDVKGAVSDAHTDVEDVCP